MNDFRLADFDPPPASQTGRYKVLLSGDPGKRSDGYDVVDGSSESPALVGWFDTLDAAENCKRRLDSGDLAVLSPSPENPYIVARHIDLIDVPLYQTIDMRTGHTYYFGYSARTALDLAAGLNRGQPPTTDEIDGMIASNGGCLCDGDDCDHSAIDPDEPWTAANAETPGGFDDTDAAVKAEWEHAKGQSKSARDAALERLQDHVELVAEVRRVAAEAYESIIAEREHEVAELKRQIAEERRADRLGLRRFQLITTGIAITLTALVLWIARHFS